LNIKTLLWNREKFDYSHKQNKKYGKKNSGPEPHKNPPAPQLCMAASLNSLIKKSIFPSCKKTNKRIRERVKYYQHPSLSVKDIGVSDKYPGGTDRNFGI
jgi:hypothetical protein